MHTTEHVHEHNHSRAEQAQGWVKSALLIGLGLYFAYNIISGNLTNYIGQRFTWLSYAAVAFFLALGIANTLELLHHSVHAYHHNNKHNHEAITWRVLLVIAVPLLLGILIPSRPLGATAVDGNISLSAPSVTNAATFTSDPLLWNVLDWLRAFNSASDVTSFNGKQAEVIGFVYREATFADNQFMVARFAVSCCVADASAIGLPVVWDKVSEFKQDTWVQIKGEFQVGEFRGDTVPILQAASIEIVDQPEHPYLYP